MTEPTTTPVTADDTAAKDTHPGESTLSSDVLDLLAAIRDALDVPLAHWEPADERARERILSARADAARIVVAGIVDSGHRIPWSTTYLAERTAATPITYTLWDSAEVCGRCGRRFDPADTRPDGQARHRDTAFCRRCVDRCHDSEDAFHKCPVCVPVPAGPATDGGGQA